MERDEPDGLRSARFPGPVAGGKVNTFKDYFATMKSAVRLRISTRRVPDFVLRYPSLLTRPLPADVAGWEIG